MSDKPLKLLKGTTEPSGQTMVEYVMLIALVALVVFITSPNVRDAIVKVFQNTSSALG